MPTIVTRGALSAQGFGFGASTGISGTPYSFVIANPYTITPFVVPAGVTTVVLEAIGSGGSNGSSVEGSGGGAYAKSIISVTPGQYIYYSVGNAANYFIWANKSANSAPSSSSDGVLARTGGVTAGGSAASSIGQITYSGGNGGAAGTYGGGGGAGGPGGAGKNGGDGSGGFGGGGGGAGGVSSSAGTNGSSGGGGTGGNGPLGTGGGAGGTYSVPGTTGTNGGGGGGAYYGTYGSVSTPGNGSTYNYWGGGIGPSGGEGSAYGAAQNVPLIGNGVSIYSQISYSILVITCYFPAPKTTNITYGIGADNSTVFPDPFIAGVDSSDNIYVVGTLNGTDLNTLSPQKWYVGKMSSTGTMIWQNNITYYGSPLAQLRGVIGAIDSSNNLYVSGTYNDGAGLYDVLIKYNSSGTLQWQQQYTTSPLVLGDDPSSSIQFDSSGNVYVFHAKSSWHITKFSPSGTNLTAIYSSFPVQSVTNQDAIQSTFRIDSSGNYYVVYTCYNPYYCCCGSAQFLIYVQKIDSSLNSVWIKKSAYVNPNSYLRVLGMVLDASNNPIIAYEQQSGYIHFQKFDTSNGSTLSSNDVSVNSTGTLYFYQTNFYANLLQIDSSGNVYFMTPRQIPGAKSRRYIYSMNNAVTAANYVYELANNSTGAGAGHYTGAGTLVLSGSNLHSSFWQYVSSGVAIAKFPKTGMTAGSIGLWTVTAVTASFNGGDYFSTETPRTISSGSATVTSSSFSYSSGSSTAIVGLLPS